jgi:hypothetical protein
MNNKFDELTKALVQSATRRQALKKFGLGLAGIALACFGLANRAHAGGKTSCIQRCVHDCVKNGEALLTCEFNCKLLCNP